MGPDYANSLAWGTNLSWIQTTLLTSLASLWPPPTDSHQQGHHIMQSCSACKSQDMPVSLCTTICINVLLCLKHFTFVSKIFIAFCPLALWHHFLLESSYEAGFSNETMPDPFQTQLPKAPAHTHASAHNAYFTNTRHPYKYLLNHVVCPLTGTLPCIWVYRSFLYIYIPTVQGKLVE